MSPVWYVAYGSNLERSRFRCYLAGGTPAGGSREYAGCGDPSEPLDDVAVEIAGRLVFAAISTVWGGGIAFYDHAWTGRVAARAYLLTREQLADVVAQETRREPGGRFARRLVSALEVPDRVCVLGTGRYETVVRLRDLEGLPAFTATCEDVALLEQRAPTAPYLRTIARGLRHAHRWDAQQVADYLARAAGVDGAWTREDLVALARPAVSR